MLAHAYKDIDFQLNMVTPGSEDKEFRQASPLGKVPGYKSAQGSYFWDSSVIIAYLEKTDEDNPLYPDDPESFAKALSLEEYADTKLAEACNALYYQLVVGPKFFDHTTDNERVEQIKSELLPNVFDYLESVLEEESWFIDNEFSVADISIGSFLVGLQHAQYTIDPTTYPKLHDFYKNFASLDFVDAQLEQEQAMLFPG